MRPARSLTTNFCASTTRPRVLPAATVASPTAPTANTVATRRQRRRSRSTRSTRRTIASYRSSSIVASPHGAGAAPRSSVASAVVESELLRRAGRRVRLRAVGGKDAAHDVRRVEREQAGDEPTGGAPHGRGGDRGRRERPSRLVARVQTRLPVARVVRAWPRGGALTDHDDGAGGDRISVERHRQLRRHAGLAAGKGAEPERCLVEQRRERDRGEPAVVIPELRGRRPRAADGARIERQPRPETVGMVDAAREAGQRDGQRGRVGSRRIRRFAVGRLGGADATGHEHGAGVVRDTAAERIRLVRQREHQRNAERHAAQIMAAYRARAASRRERLEQREHRAAVGGVGEALEGRIEREREVVAGTGDGAAQRGVDGPHAIIGRVPSPILAHNAFVRATLTNFFFSLSPNGYVLLPLHIHALGGTGFVATAVAPLFGEWIVRRLGFRTLFAISALLGAVPLALVLRLGRGRRAAATAPAPGWMLAGLEDVVQRHMVVSVFFGLGSGTIFAFLPTFAQSLAVTTL